MANLTQKKCKNMADSALDIVFSYTNRFSPVNGVNFCQKY